MYNSDIRHTYSDINNVNVYKMDTPSEINYKDKMNKIESSISL